MSVLCGSAMADLENGVDIFLALTSLKKKIESKLGFFVYLVANKRYTNLVCGFFLFFFFAYELCSAHRMVAFSLI